MRIKTKLSLGTGFLFIVILVFGILSLVSISRMKSDSALILKDNYATLVFNNHMLEALDKLRVDTAYIGLFEENLRQQEANVTEPGEGEATSVVRKHFQLLRKNLYSDSVRTIIRQGIQSINEINQRSILRKNDQAIAAAETAHDWLMIIFSVLILLTFVIAVNFPSVISQPIKSLSDGIGAIVNKDYSKRIHLNQKDEFGELANAFNIMAAKLDEYEHSNLAMIKFQKSRIEAIINQMNDGIIGFDDKKNILFLNAVAEKLLGLKETAIAGKYAADVALGNDLMRTLLNNTNDHKELKIFADNKESYFNVDTLNVSANKQFIGDVIVLKNITPFHELNEAKTNFIATVSHELKTPIAAIKMSVQLLDDKRVGEINAEQQELVRNIDEDANRLLKITSELLNMSQLETGHLQLKIESASCMEIIEEAVHSVEFTLQQKGIILKQELPPELPLVLADKEKTSWVLINFLTNAIKHSPVKGEIILTVTSNADKVSFKVRDFGKGMEKKYLGRIFDRYYKIPGASASPGSGLGLTIAKEFIEAQAGSVWVESAPDAGSSFGFDLPRSS